MLKGLFLLLSSAFLFALSTVFAKLVTGSSNISGIEVTFFRFLLGFIIFTPLIIIKKISLKPKMPKYILLRVFFNTIAVICFFMGIQYSTVSKANMLNMTYPVFVFLISPLITGEKPVAWKYIYLLITMLGLYFIIMPGTGAFAFQNINKGDALALMSGVLAGFAISYLRQSRKYDESYVILFYLMALGFLINLFIVIPYFIMPTGMILIFILLSAASAVLGQVCITVGYKYIDASAGSLVSSSRILFAVLLGITIFNDPLSSNIIIGGILILISLAGVSGVFTKKTPKEYN